MNRRGRILVEHDGKSYDLRWETQEKESVITVEYTFNGESGDMNRELPHEGVAREALYRWITSMVLCDMTEHYKELENADTATEGFPSVEPISARMKPENDKAN